MRDVGGRLALLYEKTDEFCVVGSLPRIDNDAIRRVAAEGVSRRNGDDVLISIGELFGHGPSDAGLIRVWSLPFPIDVDPAPGSTVFGPTLSVRAGVVDAINNVVPGDVILSVSSGVPASDVPTSLGGMQACDEQVADPTVPCSSTAGLGVTGYVIDGTATPVAPGMARIGVCGEFAGVR